MSLLFIMVLISISMTTAVDVFVNTTRGLVQGWNVDSGMNQSNIYYGSADVFLGIPYVQAPIGQLRFKRPMRLNTFADTINATFYRPACPQKFDTNVAGIFSTSEDCLYINVISPNVSSTSLYPVMIFIHGGAYETGYSAEYGLLGLIRNFASKNIVLVHFQYRLGVLGFFSTSTEEFPANLGMLDQVEALKWVQEEIVNFAGDKDQVTIFGESAGACSVSAHTLSPKSQGLFKQAILESGTILTCFEGALGYDDNNYNVAKNYCNFTSDMWNNVANNMISLSNCMQNVDANALGNFTAGLQLGWKIIVDNDFMPNLPRYMAENRTNIPVMFGSNRDEFAIFWLEEIRVGFLPVDIFNRNIFQLLLGLFTGYYGDQQTLIDTLIESVYANSIVPPLTDEDHLGWLQAITDAFTDASFTAFIARDIGWYLNNGNPNVYIYEFVHPTRIKLIYDVPGWTPVYHAEELIFVMMPENVWTDYADNVTDDDITMANVFSQLWTDFAKTGNPSSNWFASNISAPYQYMELKPIPQMKEKYRERARIFWNHVVPTIAGVFPPDPMPDTISTDATTDATTMVGTTTTSTTTTTTTTTTNSTITDSTTMTISTTATTASTVADPTMTTSTINKIPSSSAEIIITSLLSVLLFRNQFMN